MKKKYTPPLIRGKSADTNPGFQENISREKALGKPMKRAIGVAYGEADLSKGKKEMKHESKKVAAHNAKAEHHHKKAMEHHEKAKHEMKKAHAKAKHHKK